MGRSRTSGKVRPGTLPAVELSLNRIVGRNVRRLRRDRGLSQEELAGSLGWTREAVSATECGTNNLSLRSVDLLASCLDVTPGVLFLPPAEDAQHGG